MGDDIQMCLNSEGPSGRAGPHLTRRPQWTLLLCDLRQSVSCLGPQSPQLPALGGSAGQVKIGRNWGSAVTRCSMRPTVRQLSSTPVGPASPPQGRGVCRSWKERGRPHYLASERTVPASQPPAGSVPPSAVDTMSGEGELGEEGCGGETEAWGGKDDRAMYICAP